MTSIETSTQIFSSYYIRPDSTHNETNKPSFESEIIDAENASASLPETENKNSTVTLNTPTGKSVLNSSVIGTAKDLKKINISELSENDYKIFMENFDQIISSRKLYLEAQYAYSPSPVLDTPATKSYATVVVGGRVVAEFDNQGVPTFVDDRYARILGNSLGSINGTYGPNLAQTSAERIAQTLGGSIVKSSTALSQASFNALPPPSVQRSLPIRDTAETDRTRQEIQNLYARMEQIRSERQAYLSNQGATVSSLA
ncbi:hypothetical protein PMNALOAF_0560 [Methylobacterium adhaesivum]|uniref:Uncharacterized protein n=1 Tax=Methylobacterium adhaesivum TaxID=333297 RepID=A0ABT8BLK8_9HYPH|nr:hypothetical protein [Methylobacterium adhaesivum]MDN3592693.1 hypothetical protein [Methylobacterium adhaesivum]GJD29327.1 hypothetical protein PMNALOAF_0560 [Methylobacterium adhaesivum]